MVSQHFSRQMDVNNFSKWVTIISIIILVASIAGVILSGILDVEFAEKNLIKGEIREQSKIGVQIFQKQLFFLSITLGIIALLILIFSKNIAKLIEQRKKLFQNILVLIVTIVILIIVGEVVLRLFFADTINAEYGLGPGYDNLADKVFLNSLGFRDTEHSFDLGSAKRILIIGDSMTYGAGIEDFDDTYGRILQQKLNENYGEGSFEVIILARPGYSTIDELRLLRDLGLKFNPDILILGYQTNDAEGPTSRVGFEKLYFHHYFFPYAVGGWLYRHSYFYYLFESRLKNLLRANNFVEVTYQDYISHLYDNNNPFLEQHSKMLSLFIKLGQENGARVLVVDIPGLLKEPYPFISAMEYVENVSVANGAEYFNLLPSISGYNRQEIRVSFLDGHPNEKGQALFGEALYEYMENNAFFKANG
jgi:lysophospholipase L1-like esterase